VWAFEKMPQYLLYITNEKHKIYAIKDDQSNTFSSLLKKQVRKAY